MLTNIAKFVSALLPAFERTRIEEDLRVLRQDIQENTLPPYDAAADVYTTPRFLSRENTEFNGTFGRRVVLFDIGGANYIDIIHKSLDNATSLLGQLELEIDKFFGPDVAAAGMTYARANILRLIDLINFVVRYSRKLLLWTYHNENVAAGAQAKSPFVRADIDWIYANRDSFFQSISLLTRKPKRIIGAIRTIPDMVVVPEEIEVARQTVGQEQLDPLRLGFISLTWNPAWHAGKWYADWQATRYRSGQIERQELEYRLLALQKLQEGKSDAKLEQEIEYVQNRRNKINSKLAKHEEKMDIA